MVVPSCQAWKRCRGTSRSPTTAPGRRVELTSYQDEHDAGRRIAALATRLPVPVGQVSRRSVVLPYRRGMAAKKRPTPEDTAAARKILLGGLARDAKISDLMRELAPLHPRDNTFPGEVFLRLAADALDWCGASRADPLALEGLREQFLPECAFRGRQNKCGGRLRPRRREPGRRTSAPGMPVPGRAPGPPRAITTSSGRG